MITGKDLRKSNIAVDVVLLGDSSGSDEGGMLEKMTAFVEQVNNNGNSRLITVPPGVSISDGESLGFFKYLFCIIWDVSMLLFFIF